MVREREVRTWGHAREPRARAFENTAPVAAIKNAPSISFLEMRLEMLYAGLLSGYMFRKKNPLNLANILTRK